MRQPPKARGWALELCAGIDDDGYSFNTAAYLFTVNIVLTEAGLAAGPGFGLAPVALLFQYLQLLTKSGGWLTEKLRSSSLAFKLGISRFGVEVAGFMPGLLIT